MNPPVSIQRFSPDDFPVVGVDAHLPAIDASRLLVNALRERFQVPPLWQPEIHSEPPLGRRASTPASVLIGIVERAEPTVLLTQRTDHLSDHPGQVSFPGGRAEPEDADAIATALREAREEVGLEAQFVDVLGSLPDYQTGTGFIVTPIVARIDPAFKFALDPHEVAEVFEVPLSFLMNPSNHRRQRGEWAGRSREFLSMPWEGVGSAGEQRMFFIWGATAAMLRNFYRFIAA